VAVLREAADGRGACGVDSKTARRYAEAAVSAGVTRDGGERQLFDEQFGVVAGVVRPARPAGTAAWDTLEAYQEQVAGWVKDGLTVVKIGVLLERQGCGCRTVRCTGSAPERCGFGREVSTVPVADGGAGREAPARLRLHGHAA
jgi:hypothetical protein